METPKFAVTIFINEKSDPVEAIECIRSMVAEFCGQLMYQGEDGPVAQNVNGERFMVALFEDSMDGVDLINWYKNQGCVRHQ
jgi:hypothetical protein